MCVNSEGSGETAQMNRLASAFASRLCDKYNISWAGPFDDNLGMIFLVSP